MPAPVGLNPMPGYAPMQPPAGGQRRSVAQVVAETIQKGLLTFTAPNRMRQGTTKRIEVGIARTTDLAAELDDMFRNSGRRTTETVNTADYMTVELVGDGFTIRPLSPPTQVLVPLARWEFDVTALRSGQQTLTLVGICVVNVDGFDRQMAVPSFARVVEVDVDFAYGLRRFSVANWQWIVGTVLGLGAGIAGWIALFS
jgi:hypothetical protein